MACGRMFDSSPQNLHEQDTLTTSTLSEITNLIKLDQKLAWKSSLETLKKCIQDDLNI
jgi:hypothetical protein